MSRAEAAIVLHRLLKWIENPMEAYKKAQPLCMIDGDTVSKLLLTKDGTLSEGGLWYNLINDDGYNYVTVNCTSAQNFSLHVAGKAGQVIYGAAEVIYTDNMLTINMNENSTVILRIYDNEPFGLYDGNILLSSLGSGTYTIKGSSGQEFIALYSVTDGIKTLIKVGRNKLQFEPRKGRKYVVSGFDWSGLTGLDPLREKFEVWGAK